jgi:hypothetical protein
VRIVVNRWSKQIDLDLGKWKSFSVNRSSALCPATTRPQSVRSISARRWSRPSQTSKIALEIRRIAQQISLGVAPIDEVETTPSFLGSLLKKQRTPAQPNFKLQTSMEKV